MLPLALLMIFFIGMPMRHDLVGTKLKQGGEAKSALRPEANFRFRRQADLELSM